jgi:hypothetical protein
VAVAHLLSVIATPLLLVRRQAATSALGSDLGQGTRDYGNTAAQLRQSTFLRSDGFVDMYHLPKLTVMHCPPP